MKLLYNLFIFLTEKIGLPIASIFSKKLQKFTQGRKQVFKELELEQFLEKNIIWFHAASLGEYEQGLPIMEEVIKAYPSYELLLTFFSPSGYEVKKHNSIATYVYYLPLDTAKNAKRFIQLTQPKLAVFIKYEIWPNYLNALQANNIKSLLISGLFRKNQIYFQPYGKFLLKALHNFNHLFVQNDTSLSILQQNGITHSSISGDTRFDRVNLQLQADNHLDFIENFKSDQLCVVFGSTWPEGEEYITKFINASTSNTKYIIAPHQIKDEKIKNLKKNLNKKTILYSELANQDISTYNVLIVDTIGLLSKIYFYADIAYVGGAIGNTGLHNILEPATFGVPIIIGANHKKFPEAQILKDLGGLFSIQNYEEFEKNLSQLLTNPQHRLNCGAASKNYIQNNKGATQLVLNYISKQRLLIL